MPANPEQMLLSRRAFLRRSACAALGATGLLSQLATLRLLLAASSANAQTTGSSDYKALVCVFLYGGNDANNVIVPRDTAAYAAYAQARQSLAIPSSQLLPIAPAAGDGRTYGLHPALPELQSLFAGNHLAIVANVGTLIGPTTRDQYLAGSVEVPPQLFSHADQSVQWQTALPGSSKRTGWGGRAADLLRALNSSDNLAMNISVAGTNTFQAGDQTTQFQVGPDGVLALVDSDGSPDSTARNQALTNLLAREHRNLFAAGYSDVMSRALTANARLSSALANVPPPQTVFPSSDLANQLKMVARLIKAGPSLGFRRQIFFCAADGYDLHGVQLVPHATLLGQLSQSLNAFYNATIEYGVANQVTTFTASDFGRTLTSNGQGSDHGWGSHHFVLGGAVQGGRIYGAFPDLTLNGPNDAGDGRWIPTTAVDEYAATLATWFGVAPSDLATVLPNIGRFAHPNLGFLG